jgi:uncharacterized membrane protein YedE/YeeE
VQNIMTLFRLSLIANTVTLVVAIAAAIIRPILSYRLIAGVAICAFLASLHQVATTQGNLLALLFNILLVALMYYRLSKNGASVKKNRRP